MSIWLLLDFLFLPNHNLLPVLFLLGFITDKKVSWISLLSTSVLFDWIIFSTKYIFLIGLVILKLLEPIWKSKKKNSYLKLAILILTFLFYLNIVNQNPLKNMLQRSTLDTIIIAEVLLYFYIKKHRHS